MRTPPHSSQSSAPKAKKRISASKSLRIRVADNGDLLASVSKSSGEFFLATEVLKLISLLQREGNTHGVSGKLRKELNGLISNLPDQEEVEALVADLNAAGVLVDNTQNEASGNGLTDGFGDPWIQWAMLADTRRTQRYLDVLAKNITPDSVVLDVGAGTGVLSAFCLAAGAKSVLAIEETAMAKEIKPILEKLGIETKRRFSLFQGNSFQAPIPEGLKLVVSELFGNDPFQEGVLPTLRDIGSRVGTHVKYIPHSLEVFCELVDLKSGAVLNRVRAYQNAAQQTPPKATAEPAQFLKAFLLASKEKMDFSTLSFAHALAKEDFTRASNAASFGRILLSPPASDLYYRGTVPLKTSAATDAPVMVVWYRVFLDEAGKTTLSSHPHEADHCEHWSPIVLPVSKKLAAGTQLTLDYELAEEEDFLHVEVRSDEEILAGR